MEGKPTSRWRALAIVLSVVALFVLAPMVFFVATNLGMLGPWLEVHNASGEAVTSVRFQDTRVSGRRSAPTAWKTIAPGATVKHRMRGDPHVELTYTMGSRQLLYSEFTTAGPLETWLVTIRPDGTATGEFKLPERYKRAKQPR
jgi:hypothetical protein